MNEIEYWDEVEAIFTAVVDLEPAVRASLLETMCAGRPHIRAEVDSLLAANARAEGFALPVTAATGPMEGALPAPDVAGGTVMGAYRLVEEIGSGGMGSVYRAERIEGGFEQRVAIKLVAASMGRPDAERRFRAERQILASLRHPHIVTLLDGGVTAEGQAYLVMEHVEGVPISSYCRERVLTLEARLELFRQVCSAVHFAHRHFVVHRDLKPANILVTADGLAKVLDFGVAKLLDNPASAALPAATVAGLGPFTPNYASPEQLRGLPVTTSSDVYALGVLLYELITGGRPYETADKPFDEVMRLVLEQEPSRPSKARTPVEGGPPYHLRALEGDLDAIVLRAMSKEPERRYGSVDELAADVSRHLDGQAVQAREPSPAYLLGKLAARHKPTVTVAVVSLALLLSALAAAFWQRQAAVHARARAERRYEEVRRLANTLIFKIHDAVAPLPGSTPVRQTIVSEGLAYLDRLAAESADDPALRIELAQAYVRIGEVQGSTGAANLGDREAAIRSYRKALQAIQPLVTDDTEPGDALTEWINIHMALSMVLEGGERAAAAGKALAAATRWHSREQGNWRAQEMLARAHFRMALVTEGETSLLHWKQADWLSGLVLDQDPDDAGKQRNKALTEKYLGAHYQAAGDRERALEHYRRALALDQRRAGKSPPDAGVDVDLAIDMGNIAHIHLARGEYAEALQGYEQSLAIRRRIAEGDPRNVFAQGRLAYGHDRVAYTYLAMGQPARGLDHARRAVALYEPLTAIDAVYKGEQGLALGNLGDIEAKSGRRQEACKAYRAGHALFKAAEEAGKLTAMRRRTAEYVAREAEACKGPAARTSAATPQP